MSEENKAKLLELIHSQCALRLVRWAVRELQSVEDAEDLCQEVMFRLYDVLTRENEIEIRSMDKYLWAIAYSVLRKHRIHSSRDKEMIKPLEAQAEVDSQIADNDDDKDNFIDELLRSVIDSIPQLDELHRSVIDLYYLKKKSVRECSQIMQISEGYVKKLLFEAREQLREATLTKQRKGGKL